jgi:hypothetical protein
MNSTNRADGKAPIPRLCGSRTGESELGVNAQYSSPAGPRRRELLARSMLLRSRSHPSAEVRPSLDRLATLHPVLQALLAGRFTWAVTGIVNLSQ